MTQKLKTQDNRLKTIDNYLEEFNHKFGRSVLGDNYDEVFEFVSNMGVDLVDSADDSTTITVAHTDWDETIDIRINDNWKKQMKGES